MSKARLVITAVVVEGRSQSEVAREYGLSQPWVSRLVARYRAEGEAAFQARSRRPHSSPTATAAPVVQRILELRKSLTERGLDAGPHTLVWHLQQDQITLSAVKPCCRLPVTRRAARTTSCCPASRVAFSRLRTR